MSKETASCRLSSQSSGASKGRAGADFLDLDLFLVVVALGLGRLCLVAGFLVAICNRMAVVGRNNGSIFLPERCNCNNLGVGSCWQTKKIELNSAFWAVEGLFVLEFGLGC